VTTEADTEPTLDVETGLVEHRAVWRLAAGVLGLSLWAQLFWYPLATEFLAETTGGMFVGLYLLPVAVLGVSLVFLVPVGASDLGVRVGVLDDVTGNGGLRGG
jgi:hypothetical protein